MRACVGVAVIDALTRSDGAVGLAPPEAGAAEGQGEFASLTQLRVDGWAKIWGAQKTSP